MEVRELVLYSTCVVTFSALIVKLAKAVFRGCEARGASVESLEETFRGAGT